MVTHIWKRRRDEASAEDTPPAEQEQPRSWLPRWRATSTTSSTPTAPGGPAGLRRVVTGQRPVQAVPQTVLVDRRTARRWRARHRHNPVSATIWLAAWVAALILALGILLTWANANPDNGLVHPIMRAADWLGTPFRNAFLNPDPKQRLYADWGVAAGAYLVIGRVLSWLTRW
jgi:hypothetical protein